MTISADNVPNIIPLQQQVRQQLFNEWIDLLSKYKEYQTKKSLSLEDAKLRHFCVHTIKNLYIQLKNYMDPKDLNITEEGLYDELSKLSDTLFKLKIIDASVEMPKNKFVVDW